MWWPSDLNRRCHVSPLVNDNKSSCCNHDFGDNQWEVFTLMASWLRGQTWPVHFCEKLCKLSKSCVPHNLCKIAAWSAQQFSSHFRKRLMVCESPFSLHWRDLSLDFVYPPFMCTSLRKSVTFVPVSSMVILCLVSSNGRVAVRAK